MLYNMHTLADETIIG